MSPQNKLKKMVIRIPRHPFIMEQGGNDYQELVQMRKCRVNLERIKGMQPAASVDAFPLKPKQKRCCVRVARLPDFDRELSVTPSNTIDSAGE